MATTMSTWSVLVSIRRWAAKEAVYKAFARHRLQFPHIEVVPAGSLAPPTLLMHDDAKEKFEDHDIVVRCVTVHVLPCQRCAA